MKELQTERLNLRKLRADDAPAIFAGWVADPEVTKFLGFEPHTSVQVTEEILAQWLAAYEQPDTYRWGLENRETGELMGMIDVVRWRDGLPEIGYVLGRKHWNNGYMTEACRAVTDYLFSEGYEKIVIAAAEDNTASREVIRKTGFIYDYSEQRPLSESKPEEVTVNWYKMKRNLRRPVSA